MTPSPNKRRKLEAPTPGMSAISALAARRRLAASSQTEQLPPSTTKPSSNPFTPLQTLGPKCEQLKSATKVVPGQNSSSGKAARRQGSNIGTEPTSRAAYSSFSLSEHNHQVHDDKLELRLEEAERFLLVGSFGVRVLTGEVTVAGAVLQPSEKIVWVHAPHCHAIPVLRTAESTSLELHNDAEAEGLRKLGKLSPLFQNIWNVLPAQVAESRSRGPTSFQFLGESEDGPKGSAIQQLVCSPKWNMKLASIVELASRREPVSILVCGPKSAGKSTFSRILTNRLLTATHEESTRTVHTAATGVAVLDLDPGQPEYGPPGTVSLAHISQPNLGVPFSHPSLDDKAYKVVRCHSLASVILASTTELHLECALDLYDCYRHTLRNCPLIINTPGWILSLGLEFLVDVVAKLRPLDVIYMSEDGPAETVEALGDATRRLSLLPSQPSEYKSRTAAQTREMQTMSYFHSGPVIGSDGSRRLGWSPHALSAVRPVVVPYSGRRRGFLGILRYDYQLPLDLIADAINGMVLAMVEVERWQAFRGHSREESRDGDGDSTSQPAVLFSPEGIPVIPNPDDLCLDPRHSRTIGLILVRGVDTANKCLQVLTPTSLDRVKEARSRGSSIVLVHGKLDAPTWSYTEHLYEQAEEDEEEPESVEVTDDDDDEGLADELDGDSCREEETAVPWVEVLKGNQRRPVGSRVWRVRRDLGRGAGA
ncbi:hypothetical protein XA68_11215 [Ophiocordyceps unilateralis]|uniref:Polynucleotide 5'-hydroxyl-kinase GRC3 n=1 Tax=Ophiocordyceps unilateralis TaxID=268505 RepID=A0A2A9PQL8_OPHUN|nr:hypothetical protein XA68_11215 [Ophiocordyceps unilateralis]